MSFVAYQFSDIREGDLIRVDTKSTFKFPYLGYCVVQKLGIYFFSKGNDVGKINSIWGYWTVTIEEAKRAASLPLPSIIGHYEPVYGADWGYNNFDAHIKVTILNRDKEVDKSPINIEIVEVSK